MTNLRSSRDGGARAKFKRENTNRMTEASAKITACMMAIDNLPESGDYDARVAIWTNTKLFLEHLGETLEDDDINQDFWAHRSIHGSKRKRAYSVHGSSEKTLVVVQDELPNLNVDDESRIWLKSWIFLKSPI